MNEITVQIGGTAIAYLAGLLTKKLSKSQSSVVHEWLAPAIAAGAGIGYAAVTGGELSPEAVESGALTGAGAVFVHSLYYGLKHWRRSKR